MGSATAVSLVHRSPASASVWYAPDTLLWTGVSLLAPAIAVVLLRAVWALIMYLLRNAPESPESGGYEGRNLQLALAHPGYRFSCAVFAYALLLAAVCAFAFRSSLQPYAEPSASGLVSWLRVAPGPSAAAAMLITPALALLAASMIVVVAGLNQGAALRSTGQLSVLWLISGGIGLWTAAISYASIKAPAVSWKLSLCAGAVACATGLVRYYLPIGGQSVRDKVRAATRKLTRSIGEGAGQEVDDDAEGAYLGVSLMIYWGRLALAFTGPMLLFALGPALLMRGTGARSPSTLASDLAFGACAGAVIAAVVYTLSATEARRVRWSREGLEVAWYAGPPRSFAWDDLAELRLLAETERAPTTAWVRTKSGERFRALGGRPGYADLVKVLEARVWARDEGQASDGNSEG